MKKLFYLLLILPMVILTSCKDDIELPDTLTGTTWEYSINKSGTVTKLSLNFTSATAYTATESYTILNETITDSEPGVYTYDNKKGTVVFDGEVTGTIKDNKLTVTESGVPMVFSKK